MKKSIKLAIIALATSTTAMAAPVSQQRACDIARNYVSAMPGAPDKLDINGVEDLDGLYLVNFSPRGFAIVSADDNTEPIIGYSTESNLHQYQMPDNMVYMLTQASDIVKLNAVSGDLRTTWKNIEKGRVVMSRSDEEPVEPLIQVNFNQTSPFNYFCPGQGSQKAIVGCVAVAMSQAMSVQQYPDRPYDRVTYSSGGYGLISIDYEKENPYDWKAILSGTNNYREAARLLYHAGVSVFMDYGPEGSGIPSNQVSRITNALKTNFGYGSGVNYYWKKDYRGDWNQLLLNELYAGNAIVYNGIDTKGSGGHSFNLDGYDGRGLFHVNWGWGGQGNGYFRLTGLNYLTMEYNDGQVAVVGIGGMKSSLHGIYLPDTYVEENMPAGTIVSALTVNGEKPTEDMNIEVTGKYNASIGYESTPFEYRDGMIVTTRPLSVSEGPLFLRTVVTSKTDDSRLIQVFNVEVVKPQSIAHKTSIKYNRATKTFTVHTKYTAEYKLFNQQGALVLNGKIEHMPEFSFMRSQLSEGVNTLQITVGSDTHSVKIVK